MRLRKEDKDELGRKYSLSVMRGYGIKDDLLLELMTRAYRAGLNRGLNRRGIYK